jgi:hypothetical protein
VTDDRPATVERADAVRLLHEMAAVVRTIFAVDAAPVAPSSGGATPGPATPPVASVPQIPTAPAPAAPVVAAPPASIPVPGAAILQEIAFLDDQP